MSEQDKERESCMAVVEELLRRGLETDGELARLSICLGALEASLTNKSNQQWPSGLGEMVAENLIIFGKFVAQADAKIQGLDANDIRAKVKTVADLVWSNLTGSMSKDALHVQHLYSFTKILEAQKQQAKRHLDCAGVVVATLATCLSLARQERHAELAACRLQVSEDHCWINYDSEGAREGSVEVTTDTAVKRGLAVSEDRWRGWLYTGGRAVLCTRKMALTALVTSVNPSIVARQNTGIDSEHLQEVQYNLLQIVRSSYPEAMYPAALCALADLKEIYSQDRADEAVLANGHGEETLEHCFREDNEAQGMLEEAISMSLRNTARPLCWYPYSYLIGYLLRRVKCLLTAVDHTGGVAASNLAYSTAVEALKWCGGRHAAQVLYNYRYGPESEQLYKDVEGVLEMVCETVLGLQKQRGRTAGQETVLLVPLLELWDGICACWQGKPKPGGWMKLVFKLAKVFEPEERAQAADAAKVRSGVMLAARGKWKTLKVAQLGPLFEVADVEGIDERTAKRARR